MKNHHIAEILYEIADILELQGIDFKPRAYRKAAQNIENLKEDIEDIYKKDKLQDIAGIGENIAKKISEIIETGKLEYLEKIKKETPDIEELMRIPGLGPKKIKILNQKLKITNIKELENAAKNDKISGIEGMGEKTQKDILRGIEFLKKSKGRILIIEADNIASDIIEKIRPYCKRIIPAGSLRRKKDTVGDIDLLATSGSPERVAKEFTGLEIVKDILAKGKTKSSIVTKDNVQVDLRVVKEESCGSALNYFTGSKEHNVVLRQIAIGKGLKLSEYGVFKGKIQVAGKTEYDVYKTLGLSYIEPELRENKGEIEAAKDKKLPKLITQKEIQGDLHVHSNYSDGYETIGSMAKAAQKLGYTYIAICDHSRSQKIANGLEEKRLQKKNKEIDNLNKKLNGITILKGSEVDIKSDGTLDYPNSTLKQLDIVIAAVHSGFKQPKEKMTDRILKAMDNKYVNILAHPTGRIINKREPYAVDLDKIFQKASENNIALEINSFPERLDLNDTNIRKAKEFKLKFAINTDAHNSEHFNLIKYGLGQARRGWLEKKDVINTLSLKGLRKQFNKI